MIEVSDELYLHMTGEHLYNNRSELQEEHKETTGKWAIHTNHCSVESYYITHLFVDNIYFLG